MRDYVKKTWGHAGISNIEIERSGKKIKVTIYSARPGILIGRRGAEIDKIREQVATKTTAEVHVDIKEVKCPQIDAQLVAENIASQLERRIAFRRAMKKAVQTAMDRGAKGIRVMSGGRLGGAEIARTEGYKEGSVPLGTFRADVNYGFAEAHTTFGSIGVKVWIYTGDILLKKEEMERAKEREQFNVESEVSSGVAPVEEVSVKTAKVEVSDGPAGIIDAVEGKE